ncbi:YARHG domain-containing protein [Sporosarcina sp. 179-K 3D1 HS]|uniref:YARHG domain-containing protein n=1 Tax=Sporosarcina sp. 179-K 3D1 HS TaxID=3232169 RepID=UPI00399EF99A
MLHLRKQKRNEIYARSGYFFESKELQSYLVSQSWYYPDPFYDGSLTELEKHNVHFIKSFE